MRWIVKPQSQEEWKEIIEHLRELRDLILCDNMLDDGGDEWPYICQAEDYDNKYIIGTRTSVDRTEITKEELYGMYKIGDLLYNKEYCKRNYEIKHKFI